MRPIPAEADGTRPGSGRILSRSGRASLGLTGMGFRPGHRGSLIKNELCIFIAALCNRAGHYSFVLWFLLLSSIFFASPYLSRRRLDVYSTSTHGVAVVRIWMQVENQKKNLLNSNVSPTCLHNRVNFGLLAAEICWRVWITPANFNGFRFLAALLHGTLVVDVSQTLRRWTEGASDIRQGGHQVGR